MDRKNRKRMMIAQIMLYTVAGVLCALALVWLIASKLLRFQADYVGMSPDALAPEMTSLFLILYKTIGSSMVALGVGVALLTWKPFRRNEPWSRWTILGMVAIWAVPYTIGSIQLGAPMFVVPVGCLVLTLAALILTRTSHG